jgi:SAM-dependent methyltransferase
MKINALPCTTKEQTMTYEEQIEAAEAAAFQGWDFSYLRGRWLEREPHWSYEATVREALAGAGSLLDMGTGGGEFLASLTPLPADTAATEGYAPNVPLARRRLAPLGIEVADVGDDDALPFADKRFDLVINRHESYDPAEVYRVLKPGGLFITQQVGGQDNIDLNEAVAGEADHSYANWNLAFATAQLQEAGFALQQQEEAFPITDFYDIGAVVYYLRAIPWQIEDFSAAAYEPALRRIAEQIRATGVFAVRSHRFLIVARRP